MGSAKHSYAFAKLVPNSYSSGKCLRLNSTAASLAAEYKLQAKGKPFKHIPGPLSLPFIGNLYQYKFGYYNVLKYHKVLHDFYKKYGPIMKEDIGGKTVVHVFDPDDVKTVHQNEGKTPVVPPLQETVQLYRKQRNLSLGLGNTNGEEWYRLRSAVQKMMMRPKEVHHYLPLSEQVATDFVRRLNSKRNENDIVDDLRTEVAKWSLESAGMVCFETRLGCMDSGETEERANAMIEANRTIFYLSGLLKFSLPIFKHITTPKWKQLLQAEDFFYSKASGFVNDTIETIHKLVQSKQLKDQQYSFISYLLSRKELSRKDVTIITLSLFGDGLSTTAPSMLYNLYCLAANPDVQEKVYQEIISILPNNEPVTVEVINNMAYLKAAVKETFRLYPTGTEVSRITSKDLVLAGFDVPAGTHVDLNQMVHFHSDTYFPDAHKYIPERWLRDGSAEAMHPYLLTPFGHGTRMCAGRRFAEQDLYTTLTYILRSFRLKYAGKEALGQMYNTLLFPDQPLRIQFIPRK